MTTTPASDTPPVQTEVPAKLRPRFQRGLPYPLRNINRFFSIFGPGIVTGAADDDPSGIGTYSQAGAAFGVGQLWLALYILPFAITVQEMCGRIGLITGRGIAGVVRRHYDKRILWGAVLLLFIANTINIGADLGAMSASLRLLVPGVPGWTALVVFAVGILALEVFIPYRLYARVLKVLTLSLLTYVVTGFIINPDWGMLLHSTLIPTIEPTPEFLALIIAVVGTTISPYLFFWQASEEVEEIKSHHWGHQGLSEGRHDDAHVKLIRRHRVDTTFGMLASVTTFWFIVMVTGNTLHTHGITTITTADQAARALEPLVHNVPLPAGFPSAGEIAKFIFALGVIGTGLLAVPVLAGSAAYGVAEAFGWKEGLNNRLDHARGFYAVIAAGTLIGLALNFLPINPIAALVYAAVINGIVAVPLLVLIMRVANNKEIMHGHTNGPLSNTFGTLTVVGMGVAAIFTIVSLFIHL